MNAITMLSPYRHTGQWVFDDEAVGLRKEPFVAGIDRMIDRMTKDIPNADAGFAMFFSPTPFPGSQVKLELRRPEHNGNWYWCPELEIEGWLCPALFRYFETAPAELYVKVEGRK